MSNNGGNSYNGTYGGRNYERPNDEIRNFHYPSENQKTEKPSDGGYISANDQAGPSRVQNYANAVIAPPPNSGATFIPRELFNKNNQSKLELLNTQQIDNL